MNAAKENTMHAVDVSTIPELRRPESHALAETEVAKIVAALQALDPADWAAQTANTLWDVRAMAGHVLGMTETFSGLRPFVKNMRAGGKAAGDGLFIDGLTAVQVEAAAELSTTQLIKRLKEAGPKAARWRASRRLMRSIPMKEELADGTKETWKAGYMFDIILTRDTWMHRSDLAIATGRPMHLSAEHDGRIVAEVVAEWARRHGQPFTLHLTGPAGGDFQQSADGDELTVDAIEFCRTLSGRGTAAGLLTQLVPF